MIAWRRTITQISEHLLAAHSARRADAPTSANYTILDRESAMRQPITGWHDDLTVARQDAAYRALIEQMRGGQPRQDLRVAAEAIGRTALSNPLVLEVGCGSGYYGEIIPHLLGRPLRYVGLDYSPAMIRLAHERYPDRPFVTGDATSLPFANSSVDIVLNGVSLMHTLPYETAIAEGSRVARAWCIFHTVPLVRRRPTVTLRKDAYGEATCEVIFNEGEFRHLLSTAGLRVRHVLESIPYDLSAVLGERTVTKSYVCEVGG